MKIIIKIIGAVLLTASSSALGIRYSLMLSRHVKDLLWFENTASQIGEKIRLTNSEIPLIISQINGYQKYLHIEIPYCVTLKENSLSKNENSLIGDFFYELGLGDTVSQINRCTRYEKIIIKLREKAEAERKQKSKLFKVFGFCLGLGLSIILM